MERKNYVLVDFENVKDVDLALVGDANVEVHVLVGANQKQVPVEWAVHASRAQGGLKVIRTPRAGKNALDFVLAAVAGGLAVTDATACIHIVSQDTGFDVLVEHLRGLGRLAARHDSFREVPVFRAAAIPSIEDRVGQFRQHLAKLKGNRPGKRKTLGSTIRAFFLNQITEADGERVIEELRKAGDLEISPEGKVTFPEPAKKVGRVAGGKNPGKSAGPSGAAATSAPKPAIIRLRSESPTPAS